MTHARQLCLAVVALATSARAAGPSKAVLALRAAPARCNVTDEPKRFMVFKGIFGPRRSTCSWVKVPRDLAPGGRPLGRLRRDFFPIDHSYAVAHLTEVDSDSQTQAQLRV